MSLPTLITFPVLTPLEGGIFAELNRLAGEGKTTIVTIVGLAILAFVGVKIVKSGLSLGAVAVSLVAGGLALWVASGGLETASRIFGETFGR